jgi:DNA-binding Lrp family transcriptional regulator
MSARAYVLIECAAGTIPSIMQTIRGIEGVDSCLPVTGQYDLIAMIAAKDIPDLGKVSYSKIHMIEGVIRTITCNVIDLD